MEDERREKIDARRDRPGAPRAMLVIAAALMLLVSGAARPLDEADRPSLATDAVSRLDPTLRVRLAADVKEVALDAPRGVRAVESARRRGGRDLIGPVLIYSVGERVFARDARGRTRSWPVGAAVSFEPIAERLSIEGALYPGAAVIHPKPGGAFDLVEHVPIEEYLPGVLTRELYPGWSDAAYEAQAIAARSYALHERQRRIALGSYFDIESDTRDQAYGGFEASDLARRAVERTRGVTLTYLGSTLRAYYSSTCGDRPGSARDTWPTGRGFEFNLAGPIQAAPRECACSFSPRHRWSVERDHDELVPRLRAFGADQGLAIRDITSLASIEPERRNTADRPATYRITDRDGKHWRLSAEELRLALNHAGSSGLDRPGRETAVWSGDVEVKIADGRVGVTGRGFGHGVGMCQFGAEGYARQGWSAEQILAHFYPNAELTGRSP